MNNYVVYKRNLSKFVSANIAGMMFIKNRSTDFQPKVTALNR